jgi:transcription antitermination factor NusG
MANNNQLSVNQQVRITVGNFKNLTGKVAEYRAEDDSYKVSGDGIPNLRWYRNELEAINE